MTPSAKTAEGHGDHGHRLTREDIIEAIRRWAALFGEPPVTADWNPSVARWRAQEWRIERYRAGDPETGAAWPSLNAVKRRFGGSFAAAVREAGFTPRRPGPPRAAHAARPARAPRTDAPPTEVELLADEAAALRAALAAAEARAAAAERGRAVAERRADRADQRAREARLRARRSADRERRAKAARERALARERAAREEAALALARAVEEAQAQVLRAEEARADAERARARALRATDGRRHARRPVVFRADPAPGAAGPGVLAEALTAVTRARTSGDRFGLQVALSELADASAGWRDRL